MTRFISIVACSLVFSACSGEGAIMLDEDGNPVELEQIATVPQASVFGPNDDRDVSYWSDALDSQLTGVGAVNNASCSGTLIAPNKVLTAQHCGVGPGTTFRPHGFAAADTATALRAVRGRDVSDTQAYADWAILTLDRSYNGLTTMRRGKPAKKVGETQTVNVAGYSGDLQDAARAGFELGVHEGCSIKNWDDPFNAPSNPAWGLADMGLWTDCDWKPGASGGPMYTVANGVGTAVGVVSGAVNVADKTPYTSTNANVAGDGEYFRYAPDNAVGLGVTYDSSDRMKVYATDRDWSRVYSRAKVRSTAWEPWGGYNGSTGSITQEPVRMAALNLTDGREQLFVIGSSGALNTSWFTTGGIWRAWESMATPVTLKDIATIGGNGVTSQIFALGTNNTVYTTYKVGDSLSDWSAWCSLGTVSGARGITAVRFGSTQQVFVAASTGAWTSWGSGNACSSFNSLRTFKGTDFYTIAAGRLQDGRVHVLAVPPNSTNLQQRIRSADGTSWSAWKTVGMGSPSSDATRLIDIALIRDTDSQEHIFVTTGDASNAGGEIFVTWETATAGVFKSTWRRFYR